jgi:hypothetical protein
MIPAHHGSRRFPRSSSLRDIASVLATADPKDKAEVYRDLGLRVTYDPERQLESVSAGPCVTARVGGRLPACATRGDLNRTSVDVDDACG